MHMFICPGLPASWINGWLAGIGATVLDRRIRLHWSAEDAPVAVFSSAELDPVDALVESWPDEAFLYDLPIARDWSDAGELRRNVPVEQFVERARAARGHPHAWTLSSTMTDLSIDQNGEVAHAPFDPPVPRGFTIHERLLKACSEATPVSRGVLQDSLLGMGERVRGNGLGFDCTRVGSLADMSDKWIEPVVELLAFFGLAEFPLRGWGVDRRPSHHLKPDERQRGWRKVMDSEERRFVWPAWRQPLDAAGIDALLDVWKPWRKGSWAPLGVHAAWQSVRYQRRGSADPTRAIGAAAL